MYPLLEHHLEHRDLDELADASGLPVILLLELRRGGLAPPPALRVRIARALELDPVALFRMDDDEEEALADAPSRHITDPATLRLLDRRLS